MTMTEAQKLGYRHARLRLQGRRSGDWRAIAGWAGRRLQAIAVFVLVLAAVVACGGAEEREARHIDRGKELFQAQEFEKARVEFRNALKINPGNVEALYYVAQIHERNQNWRGALNNYAKAAQQDPRHLPSQVKLGQLYLLGNTYDKAEEQARIASEIDPKDPGVLLLRATIALRKDDLATARALTQEALGLDPDNLDGVAMLAAIDMRDNQPDRALETLDAALARHPASVQLRLVKIKLHAQRNDLAGVESVYRELIAIDPQNIAYRTQLARIYAAKDNIGDAEKLLRDTVAQGIGGKDAKLVLIDLLAQRRSFEDAEKELKALMAAEPGETAFPFKLADLYNANNKPELAEAVLRAVVEREETKPAGLAARVGLARLMLARGDAAAAGALAGEVIKEDPSNSEALMIRARLALARGDHQAALGDVRTVLRNAPDSIPALKLQADAQFQGGQTELGLDTLQRLVQLDPRDTDLRLRLAAMLAQRGNRAAALKLLEEAPKDAGTTQAAGARAALLIDEKRWTEAEAIIASLRENPDNQRLADSLEGGYQQARGNHPEAIAAFKRALATDPDASELIAAITRSMLAQQKPEDALAFLRAHAQQHPQNAVTHNLLGELLTAQDQLAAAEASLLAAIQAKPRWVVPYLNLARLYSRTGRPEKAVEVTRSGLAEDPQNTGLMVAHAAALESAGKHQAAIDVYDTLLQSHPDLEVAINNYGALVADFRPKDMAAVQRALTLAKRFETSTNPLFVDTLGWLQYRAGDLAQARVNLERAVKLRSDLPQLQYHLGMVLRDLGEKQMARQVLERAVVDGATYPGIDEARAALSQL
jgi:tetratricopeptide (TPR) repeat protein